MAEEAAQLRKRVAELETQLSQAKTDLANKTSQLQLLVQVLQGFQHSLKAHPQLRALLNIPDEPAKPIDLSPPAPSRPVSRSIASRREGLSRGESKATAVALSGRIGRTLEGHSDVVYCLAAVDEKRVASGSSDSSIVVWDVVTGLGVTLVGHEKAVHSIAVVDDNILASGSADRTIRLWSLVSGQCVRTLAGHKGTVRAVCMLDDGRLASGSSDKSIRFWDPSTGQCLNTLLGYSEGVTCLAVLENDLLAAGSDDGAITIWNTTTGQFVRSFSGKGESKADGSSSGHLAPVNSICALSDDMFATASDDNTVRVYSVSSGLLHTLVGHGDIVNGVVALSKDRIVSASSDTFIKVWDLASGQPVASFEEENTVLAVAVTPSGSLVTASGINVSVWE